MDQRRQLAIGYMGHGLLAVTNGGTVSDGTSVANCQIGYCTNSSGTVAVNGAGNSG